MKLVEKDLESLKRLAYKEAHKVQQRHGGLLNLTDLQQAALAGIVEAAASWDGDKSKLSTWAFHAVRGRVQQEARRQRHALSENVTTQEDEPCNVIDVYLPRATAGLSGAEDQVNRAQLHEVLISGIRQLPSKHQAIMLKIFLKGETATEIAEQDGTTKQNVNAMYLEACRRLRGWLRANGIRSVQEVF